jgi:hypothetical protein
MTSKNGADFGHFVMPAQAPASQNGQSRALILEQKLEMIIQSIHEAVLD